MNQFQQMMSLALHAQQQMQMQQNMQLQMQPMMHFRDASADQPLPGLKFFGPGPGGDCSASGGMILGKPMRRLGNAPSPNFDDNAAHDAIGQFIPKLASDWSPPD